MSAAKTPAERKRDEVARRKRAGLVAVTLWVLPETREALRRHAERLTRAAAKARQEGGEA